MPAIRDYQRDIISKVSDEVRRGTKAILIQLATGGGKTVVAGSISRSIARRFSERKGCACLYLVHRRELVDQVANTLDDFGLGDYVGVIQADRAITPWASLQVASVQTLVNRLDKYKWLNPRVIFIDEAHHIRARTWEKILEHYSKAYRIGLTATPARLDGKGLGKHFEVMIEGPTTEELVRSNWLCQMKCFSIPAHIDLNGMKKSGGDYAKGELAKRTNKKFRADIRDFIARHCSGRQTIHFACSVDDSKRVVAKLKSDGYAAEHIDGKTPPKIRKKILKEFATGTTQIVSNYEIITEGFDVPEASAIVISRKTMSEVLFRQMVGRGRRPKPDGGIAVLGDLVGNMEEHEHPDIDPEFTLEDGHIPKEKKPTGVSYRACAQCNMVYNRKSHSVCPNCGGAKQRQTAEDVKIALVEKKAEESRLKRQRWRKANSEVYWSRGDPDKLKEIAKKYGFNPYIVDRWEKIYEKHWEQLKDQDRYYEAAYRG